MKRKILYWTLAVGVIVVMSSLWIFQAMRHPGSEGSPEARLRLDLDKGGSHHSSQPTDSDSRTDAPETRRNARERMPQEQRAALERAVAVQEKFVEEKRTAMASWVRSNAVPYNPSDPPVAKAPDSDKRVTEVGGYVDLKKGYEVELKNLERLKSKLDEL